MGTPVAAGSIKQSGPPPSAIRVVDKEHADLHLWVSNQSFKDNPVVLTATIDDTVVVAQPFEVGNQHNWILFPVKVPPGRHTVKVVSGTGVEMRESFTTPETERRYAVVDYWTSPGDEDRQFTWRIQSSPVVFL